MIDCLKSFTVSILTLSIFIEIMRLILPKGKLRQNISFVCYMMITFKVLEPIITLLNTDIDFNKLYEEQVERVEIEIAKNDFEKNYQEMLYQTFEENIEEDMIQRLQKAGYLVNSVSCEIDHDTFEPKFLRVEIQTEDGFIEPIRIEVMGNYLENDKLSEMQKYEINHILMESYGVTIDQISINREVVTWTSFLKN